MNKMLRTVILPLTAVLTLAAFPVPNAYAYEGDRRPAEHSQSEDVSVVNDTPDFIYDENGNVVDYWFGAGAEDDRDVQWRPECDGHDYELVHKYIETGNGCKTKVYNKRCRKCWHYKYSS